MHIYYLYSICVLNMLVLSLYAISTKRERKLWYKNQYILACFQEFYNLSYILKSYTKLNSRD